MQIQNTQPSISSQSLESYMELGNNAIKEGKMKESLNWYMKGLNIATETKNTEKISEFSGLIFTLL